MAHTVVMPKLGLTMDSGAVRWSVSIGDVVSSGQTIGVISTDKLDADFESPVGGTVLRVIEPQEDIPVGAPIALISDSDPNEDVSTVSLYGDADTSIPADRAEAPGGPATEPSDPQTATKSAGRGPRMRISPLARKLAASLGVDVSDLLGTGPGGRITRQDVEDAAAGITEAASAEAAAAPSSSPSDETPSAMRRAIAASMNMSAAIPQYSLERDVDVGALEIGLRYLAERLNEDDRPTVADAITVAVARSLRQHPAFMRSWEDGVFRVRDTVNLGLAVAVPDGLVVPVISGADQLTIAEAAAARRRLQQIVGEQGPLAQSEMSGAVFTISNLGALGVDRFRALVSPSESGILAVGRVGDREGRRMITLCLSADHRVCDGADGARLLAEVAERLSTRRGIDDVLRLTTNRDPSVAKEGP